MWFKFHLSTHSLIKPVLLELLSKQKYTNVLCDETCISKTDWYVDVGLKREYFDYLLPFLLEEATTIYQEQLKYEDFSKNSILNFWFQQYYKNDTHSWHRHPLSSFNNVYYVELPKDAPGTELMIPVTNQVFAPHVEEGDVLIFPSAFLHRSTPNNSNKNKTVISFNVK
jgi:hypothetical protein